MAWRNCQSRNRRGDTFYLCTLSEGHAGDHRSGSTHSWPAAPPVGEPAPTGMYRCERCQKLRDHGRDYPCNGIRLCAPDGEPAPMPPVEVGDWVHEQGDEYAFIVDADYGGLSVGNDYILEIRKADGRVWRRADRKEPGQ